MQTLAGGCGGSIQRSPTQALMPRACGMLLAPTDASTAHTTTSTSHGTAPLASGDRPKPCWVAAFKASAAGQADSQGAQDDSGVDESKADDNEDTDVASVNRTSATGKRTINEFFIF